MAEITKTQKGLIGALAAFGVASAFTGAAPIDAHASDRQQVSDVSVKVDDAGKITYGGDLANKDRGQSWTDLIARYRFFIAGISGIGAVSMILFFIINFMKLGATSANPQERSRAIMGLVFSGLAAAGLGAVTFIVGIFFNAL